MALTPEYIRRVLEARKAKEAAFQQTLQDNQRRIMEEYEERQRRVGKPPKISVTLARYWGRRKVR